MFYDRLKEACQLRGTTITAVTKKLNLSTSSGSNWKSGQTPKATTVQKIADYLNVPVEYLLSDNSDPHNRLLTDDQLELLKIYDSLDEARQLKLIGQVQVLALFDKEDFIKILQLMKQIRVSGVTIDEVLESIQNH